MSEKLKKLEDLHELLAQKLLDKIISDEVKSADLNVARQFLKDNNIDCIPKSGNAVSKLAEELPFKIEDLEEIVRDKDFN
jgi:hypothetical protein